ncbi:MAG TPA: sterol desaturase family protein [Verrucomicrobiales bacterium]|nr:sterol desaturase family protein [Verrucomicrobiales bacterium]
MNLADLKPYFAFGLLALLLLWEMASPFLVFPKGRARLVHGLRNVLLGVGNGLFTAFAFAGLWWFSAETSAKHGIGLLHWLSWSAVTEGILAVLLLDLWTYVWHRLNHHLPFLWRFHRVHHSDPHMDVTTANRFHIGEIVLSSVLRIPLIFLLGIQIEQLALYEALMFAVVQFHHANISLGSRGDRVLSWFIVTPFMHKVHHSRWQPETDSNYASLLSVWDRVFRSFRHSKDPASLRLGLDEFSDARSQTLAGMLTTPLASKPRPHDSP